VSRSERKRPEGLTLITWQGGRPGPLLGCHSHLSALLADTNLSGATFPAAAASVWNSLPETVHASPSLPVFHRRLNFLSGLTAVLTHERLTVLTTMWPHITVTCPCYPRTLCHVKLIHHHHHHHHPRGRLQRQRLPHLAKKKTSPNCSVHLVSWFQKYLWALWQGSSDQLNAILSHDRLPDFDCTDWQ